jgi:hypothetical protein
LGEKSFPVGLSYDNIAFDYRGLKNWDKALEMHNKGKDIYLQIFSSKHPYYAGSMALLAEVYESKGDKAASLEHFNNANQLFINLYGAGNELSNKIQKKIEELNTK